MLRTTMAALMASLLAMVAMFVSESALAAAARWDRSVTLGWARGAAGTLYAEWNVFTDDANATGIVDNTPEVGRSGGTFSLVETSGTGFLTSGGNIYSFASRTGYSLRVTPAASTTVKGTRDVVLRIASLGNLFDYASFTLNSVKGTFQELYTQTISGGFGGVEKEFVIRWNDIANASKFVFGFAAAASSVSLDQLSVDFSSVTPAAITPTPITPTPTTVPVPAAVWLFGSALGAFAGIVRLRRHATG